MAFVVLFFCINLDDPVNDHDAELKSNASFKSQLYS